jgi:hypothetical protein
VFGFLDRRLRLPAKSVFRARVERIGTDRPALRGMSFRGRGLVASPALRIFPRRRREAGAVAAVKRVIAHHEGAYLDEQAVSLPDASSWSSFASLEISLADTVVPSERINVD